MTLEEIIAIVDRAIAPPMSRTDALEFVEELIEQLEATAEALQDGIRHEGNAP